MSSAEHTQTSLLLTFADFLKGKSNLIHMHDEKVLNIHGRSMLILPYVGYFRKMEIFKSAYIQFVQMVILYWFSHG